LLAKEQQECDSRFRLTEKIGEGTYGVVYKAIDLSNNQVSVGITRFFHISYSFPSLKAILTKLLL